MARPPPVAPHVGGAPRKQSVSQAALCMRRLVAFNTVTATLATLDPMHFVRAVDDVVMSWGPETRAAMEAGCFARQMHFKGARWAQLELEQKHYTAGAALNTRVTKGVPMRTIEHVREASCMEAGPDGGRRRKVLLAPPTGPRGVSAPPRARTRRWASHRASRCHTTWLGRRRWLTPPR